VRQGNSKTAEFTVG